MAKTLGEITSVFFLTRQYPRNNHGYVHSLDLERHTDKLLTETKNNKLQKYLHFQFILKVHWQWKNGGQITNFKKMWKSSILS